MKRHSLLAAAWLIVVATITFSVVSQVEPALSIQWKWNERRVLEVIGHNKVLQLGLGSDGRVYWQEVVNVTNSPAEEFIRHRSSQTPRPVPPVTNSPPPLPR